MISDRHEALERMSPVQKIRHWSQHEPWSGIRVSQLTVIGPNQIVMDADWNIIRSPLLVGKPCFGQPTAFARHGGVQPILHPVRGLIPSRCMRCTAKDACENVAKKRLRVTTEVQDAYRAFERAGGAYGLKHQADCPAAQRQFDALVQALVRHGGFTNVNDSAVLAHYAHGKEKARQAAAQRKRRARLTAARRGDLDDDVLRLLDDHRRWREARLRLAIRTPGMFWRITRLPPSSAPVTADAWLARLLLQMRRAPVNNSSIAAQMMKLRLDRYTNHNSLRQRVERDLLRVDMLERLCLPGEESPVWPRFDLQEALIEDEQLSHYRSLLA